MWWFSAMNMIKQKQTSIYLPVSVESKRSIRKDMHSVWQLVYHQQLIFAFDCLLYLSTWNKKWWLVCFCLHEGNREHSEAKITALQLLLRLFMTGRTIGSWDLVPTFRWCSYYKATSWLADQGSLVVESVRSNMTFFFWFISDSQTSQCNLLQLRRDAWFPTIFKTWATARSSMEIKQQQQVKKNP